MRERLIELLNTGIDEARIDAVIHLDWLADYLLNNGVAVENQGKWANAYSSGEHFYRCTECGKYIEAIWTGGYDFKYCPNCGVKMEEAE